MFLGESWIDEETCPKDDNPLDEHNHLNQFWMNMTDGIQWNDMTHLGMYVECILYLSRAHAN